MPENNPCPLCNASATQTFGKGLMVTVECQICGPYQMDRVLLISTQNGTPIENAHLLSGNVREYMETSSPSSEPSLPSITRDGKIDAADIRYPVKIAEKAARILAAIGRRAEFGGQTVTLQPATDYPLGYAKNHGEFSHFLDYLRDAGLITRSNTSDGSNVALTPKGTEELETQQTSPAESEATNQTDGNDVDSTSTVEPSADIELIRKVDSGLFGQIWEGRQKSLDRKIAVKMIFPSMAHLSSAIEHAKALARLNHPNIVTVHQVAPILDPDSGNVVDAVIMEWLDGQHLGDTLNERSVDEVEARSLCTAIITSVQHLHDNGLTHGDLHPGNVFVGPHATKIIDIKYSETQSLARLSTTSQKWRIQSDLDAVCYLVRRILQRSGVALSRIASHESELQDGQSIDQIRAAVDGVFAETDVAVVVAPTIGVQIRGGMFTDEHRVAGFLFTLTNTGTETIPPYDLIIFHPALKRKSSIFPSKIEGELLPEQRREHRCYIFQQHGAPPPVNFFQDEECDSELFSMQLVLKHSDKVLYENNRLGRDFVEIYRKVWKAGSFSEMTGDDAGKLHSSLNDHNPPNSPDNS